MRVDVYRNLNKKGVQYSIRHKGKVIDYRTHVHLADCRFKHPTPAALNRIRDGHREVCAWITGDLVENQNPPTTPWYRLACDPKHQDTFNDAHTRRTVDLADHVILTETGLAYYANKEPP